jgi:hemolysin activation/secretion protein
VDPASRAEAVAPRAVDPLEVGRPVNCPFTGRGAVTLTSIDVIGASLVSKTTIDSTLADLIGRPTDLSVLCIARDRVAKLYSDRGEALVRVDLPEQRVSNGRLTLQVTEGDVQVTTLRNGEAMGAAAARAAAYLGQVKGPGATSWAQVERAFLLTREIPGADVGFSISNAGTDSPNALEAVATFRPRRSVDIGLSGHNLGSSAYGRAGGTARLDFNSFTPLAERTTLIASSSHTGDQRVFQLLEEFRPGASGLIILGDIAFGRSRPGGALEELDLKGHSLVGRIGARYPLVRRRSASFDVGARFEAVNQKNTVGFLEAIGGSTFTLSKERLRVAVAEASGRFTPASARGFAIGAGVELRQGINGLGSSDKGDALLSRGDADPGFTAIRINASARYAIPAKSLSPWIGLNLSGQWAAQGLPAYEEYQIGNYSVGRGYEPGAASGDRGIGAQFEAGAEVPVSSLDPLFSGPSAVGPFAFADIARVWNADPLSYDKTISSLGGGLRLHSAAMQLSLFYAKPQKAPIPTAKVPGGRVYLTLGRSFSIR